MEKSCIFYASKYHLSFILLEFLKSINIKKYTVKTFLQNPIEHEISIIKKEYKIDNTQINNIDFKKTNNIKQKKIKNKEDNIFIIEGSQEYVKKVLNYIKEKKIYKTNGRILCCYNYNLKKEEIIEILNENFNIITTTGERHLTNYY